MQLRSSNCARFSLRLRSHYSKSALLVHVVSKFCLLFVLVAGMARGAQLSWPQSYHAIMRTVTTLQETVPSQDTVESQHPRDAEPSLTPETSTDASGDVAQPEDNKPWSNSVPTFPASSQAIKSDLKLPSQPRSVALSATQIFARDAGSGCEEPGACGPMDVVFVIDDTGSMGGALDGVKQQLTSIMDDIECASNHDYRLALLSFKDDVTIRENLYSGNRVSVATKIQSLSASGGNYGPEASDEALYVAINTLSMRPSARKVVVLVTDAPPGGTDDDFQVGVDDVRAHSVAVQASGMDVKISSVYITHGSYDSTVGQIMRDYGATSGGSYHEDSDGTNSGAAIRQVIAECGGSHVDLDIDANNDGQIDDDDESSGGDEFCEDTESRIGALISFNDDDDNDNSVEDYLDSASPTEDDLAPLRVRSFSNVAGPTVLNILEGQDKIKIWKDAAKTEQISSFPYTFPTLPSGTPSFTKTLYVEGVDWGAAKIEMYKQADKAKYHDEVRVFSSTVDIDLPDEVEAGHNPMVSVSGLPEGSSITFQVFKNGSLLQSFSKPIEHFVTVTEIDISSSSHSPGDVYVVKASADQGNLELESVPCVVVAGPPAFITYIPSKLSLIADQHDQLQLDITVTDVFGNLVEDGTPVEVTSVEKISDLESAADPTLEEEPELLTVDGKATANITAPAIPDLIVDIASGTVVQQVSIPLTDVTATLATTTPELHIDQEQVGTVTLATNASEGTPVYWSISNFAEGDTGVRETVVSGGQASLTVPTANTHVGDCYVTATVGGQLAIQKFQFVDESPVRIELDHYVLTSDLSENTIVDVPFPTPNVASGVEHAQVPLYAVATGKLYGPANTRFQLRVDDTPGAHMVRFVGTNTDGELVTDANGVATFTLRSLNIGDSCTHSAETVTFDAIEVVPPSILETSYKNKGTRSLSHTLEYDPSKHKATLQKAIALPKLAGTQRVKLVDSKTQTTIGTYTWDAVRGFFGADTETGYGMTGSIAGGYCVVGDVGAIIKNVYRMGFWSKTKPNYLELSLTVIGLLADLGDAEGVGLAANGVINTARVIVVRLGDGPFTRALVGTLKKIATNRVARDVDFWKTFARFLKVCLSREGVKRFAINVLHSGSSIISFIKCYQKYGEQFLDGIHYLGRTGVSRSLGVSTLTALKNIDGAVVTQLISHGSVPDFVINISSIFDHLNGYTRLLPQAINRLRYENVFFQQSYHIGHFADDIRVCLSRGGKDGIMSILRDLANVRYNTPKGPFFELRASSVIARESHDTLEISEKWTRTFSNPNTPSQNLEFDLIRGSINRIYYQMKSSADAFYGLNRSALRGLSPSAKRAQARASVFKHCERCLAHAQATGKGIKEIVYTVPSGVDVPLGARAGMREFEKQYPAIKVSIRHMPFMIPR